MDGYWARLCGIASTAALLALAGCSGNSGNDMTAAKSLLSPAGQNTAAAPDASTPAATAASTTATTAATTSTDIKPVSVVSAGTAPAAPVSATGEQKITSFKKRTAVLYSSARGTDGERIDSSTFAFPMLARPAEGSGDRLEIMTVKGPRWVMRSEINLEGATPASQVTAAARPN